MKLIIDDMIDANENLLLTNKFITGFRLKLALTSDNIVIVLPSKMDISLTNLTFKEIKKMNQNLYTLKETLEIFKNYQKELRIGMTMFGPHRDDFQFQLNDVDMKLFSSQGQQKSAVLAYKLSTIPIFEEKNGTKPVLLLDDIFSELDLKKKNRLLKYVNQDIQSIITTTDLKNISKKSLENATIFKVSNGNVERSNN